MTLTARSHRQAPDTLIGVVAIAAGVMALTAALGSAAFVPIEARRRSVSPIRRRGHP